MSPSGLAPRKRVGLHETRAENLVIEAVHETAKTICVPPREAHGGLGCGERVGPGQAQGPGTIRVKGPGHPGDGIVEEIQAVAVTNRKARRASRTRTMSRAVADSRCLRLFRPPRRPISARYLLILPINTS